jgi:hypothetical protein
MKTSWHSHTRLGVGIQLPTTVPVMTKTQQPTMIDPDNTYLLELVSWLAEPSSYRAIFFPIQISGVLSKQNRTILTIWRLIWIGKKDSTAHLGGNGRILGSNVGRDTTWRLCWPTDQLWEILLVWIHHGGLLCFSHDGYRRRQLYANG